MKKILSAILMMSLAAGIVSASAAPKKDQLKTPWADKVTPENVWQSYPRPQLERAAWINLNGTWNYSVTDHNADRKSVAYEGEILVPFAIESYLSGVQQAFLPTDKLWYKRTFTTDKSWLGKSVILHFGAVDYECQVWVNGKLAGSHKGGNNPFSFDITKLVNKSGKQVVEVAVVDPTDTESISRGKQQLSPRGIWYTPVSGIWKTVWVEAVNPTHIRQILPTADIAKGSVTLDFDVARATGTEKVKIEVLDGGKSVSSVEMPLSGKVELSVPNAQLWTPQNPKLYHINVELVSKGKTVDKVHSYFALREVGIVKDECGYKRIALNGETIFQYGPLDQGWWPDGLLTPPSEEAMIWDMVQLKKMGFNTIRKHIKVEPEQYYYYADSLGLMLWQDMVSGFSTERKETEHVKAFAPEDWNASEEHSAQWQGEMFEMIDRLRFYPSITTWVVFNEGWGQHNTVEIVKKVMDYDKSRIIDGVTGWTDRKVGDLYDVHNYPSTSMILTSQNDDRISVLGEFGGYGWAIQDHLWNPEMRNWGYKNISDAMSLMSSYGRIVYDLESLVAQGLGAAIYTQTTDVEGEVNGLITYDRQITKIPADLLHVLHDRLYNVKPAKAVTLVADTQEGAQVSREVSVNGGKAAMAKLPLAVNAKSEVVSTAKFRVEEDFDHLSLLIHATGQATVWLNGVEIFAQDVRQTRQHNQYNVSDYSQYLVKGENELKIRIAESGKMEFDFGLRAY